MVLDATKKATEIIGDQLKLVINNCDTPTTEEDQTEVFGRLSSNCGQTLAAQMSEGEITLAEAYKTAREIGRILYHSNKGSV